MGAVAAGFLSRGKIEMGLVPIGALGMALFAALMAVPQEVYGGLFNTGTAAAGPGAYFYFLAFSTFGLGFFAGVFDVPLAAAIQHRAPRGTVGGVIATTNMLTFVGMAASAVFSWDWARRASTPTRYSWSRRYFRYGIGVYISIRLPHLFLRAGLWLLANTLVRIRVHGREQFPDEGGALLVGTHISFIDVLAVYGATDRDIYFVVGDEVFTRPLMGRLARFLNIIPAREKATEADQEALAQQVRQHLAVGDIVCINNEQRTSEGGAPFAGQTTYEPVLRGLDIPMIPFYQSRLSGIALRIPFDAGSIGGGPSRLPLPHRYPLRRAALVALRAGGFAKGTSLPEPAGAYRTAPPASLLHRGFIRMARRNLFRIAVEDMLSAVKLTYFETLVGTIVFARQFHKRLDKQAKVGVLLPPSVGSTLTNVALQILGRRYRLTSTTPPATRLLRRAPASAT